MKLTIELEEEIDGRWIAEVTELGALAYGKTKAEAIEAAKALALHVIADRPEHGEGPLDDVEDIEFFAA